MQKIKDFFKKPMNVVILVFMILYVIFGLRTVADASELSGYYIDDLPEYPSDILDNHYILVSSHSDSKDTIAYYLLIFDDISNITSDFMADTVNSGTTSFTLQGVNGVRYWYQFSFDDGWVKSSKSGDTFSLNPIQLHIHQATFDVPYTYDSSVIAIPKNTDIIMDDNIIVDDVPDWDVGVECDVVLPSGTVVTVYPDGYYSDCPYVVIVEMPDNIGSGQIYYSSSPIRLYDDSGVSFISSGGIYEELIFNDIRDDSLNYNYVGYNSSPIVWSSYDVPCSDGDTIFFHQASLPRVQGVAKMTPKMIVQMTLQGIGGIMAVVVLSVVGFLAFRKAWNFLKTALHQA